MLRMHLLTMLPPGLRSLLSKTIISPQIGNRNNQLMWSLKMRKRKKTLQMERKEQTKRMRKKKRTKRKKTVMIVSRKAKRKSIMIMM